MIFSLSGGLAAATGNLCEVFIEPIICIEGKRVMCSINWPNILAARYNNPFPVAAAPGSVCWRVS